MYVVSVDTMIENPLILNYLNSVLEKIEKQAVVQGIPIRVWKAIPRLENSFWVNVIGRGYPIPNSSFRWCTDKLKILPTSRFVNEQLDEKGNAIILLGSRLSESAARAITIKKFSAKGKRLSKNPNQANTFVYSPIKYLSLDEVWYILNTMESPWGADNSELSQIYADASSDDYECPPLVTNKKHQSCGNSRFGCWVCTVVREDKSMASLIDNGATWLKPLLDFRNSLVLERNLPNNRMKTRRNGQLAINEMGTYTPEYRAKILKRLLETQKVIQANREDMQLISNQELVAIQVTWYRDLIFDNKVSIIYNSVFEKEIDMEEQNDKLKREEDLLRKSCKSNDDFHLIQELLTLQKNKSLLNRKRGLKDDIERRIEAVV